MPDTNINPHQKRPHQVSIHNWREHPGSQWAFHHVCEIIPSAPIRSSPDTGNPLPDGFADFSATTYDCNGIAVSMEQLCQRTHTDGLVILKSGQVIYRYEADYYDSLSPHILFSVSKSITALVAGILQDQGSFDPESPVAHYLPGVKGGVYENCTIRHILDMTVALDFEENYTDDNSEYMDYRQATAWNPADQNNPGPSLEEFLYRLRQSNQPHGHAFLYRSPNSDLLGLALEQASGIPYPRLLSDLLWKPLGARYDGYVTVDRYGVSRAAGGICITLDDFARVGQLIADGGWANERSVVSTDWIEDTIHNGDKDAWDRGNYAQKLPNGRYRNKWYQIGDKDQSISARGIHGQLLYINHKRNVVAARVSSQPEPLNEIFTASMLTAFDQIAQTF